MKTKSKCAPCSPASPNCWARAPMPRASRSPPWWRAMCPSAIRDRRSALAPGPHQPDGQCRQIHGKRRRLRRADNVRRPRARLLRVEVRDTGVGVPPQKRQEIFQEFVQADSSHARKFGGSGLGLAISKRLVETMGGEIGIEPRPERPHLLVHPAGPSWSGPPIPAACRCKASASPSSAATRCCAKA